MKIQKRQMLGEYYLAGLICSGDWAKVFAGDYPRPCDISEMARMEEKFLPYGYEQRKVALFNPENPRHNWLAFDAFACAGRLSDIIRDLGADQRGPLTPQEMVYLARCRWEEQPEFGASNLVGPEPDYGEDSFAPDMGPNVASMDAKTHDAAMSVLYACMTEALPELDDPEAFFAPARKADSDTEWAMCGILGSEGLQEHVRPESRDTLDREFARAMRKARGGALPNNLPFLNRDLPEIGTETISRLAAQARVAARKLGRRLQRNSEYMKKHFGVFPIGSRLTPFETLYVISDKLNGEMEDSKFGLFEGTRKFQYWTLFRDLGEHEARQFFEPADRIVRWEVLKEGAHPIIRAAKATRPIRPM